MNQPKRHHHIAQMIQRNFADSSGQLYFWRRDFAVGDVRRISTGKLFVEKDLYTFTEADGSKNVALEEMLAELDGAGASFLIQMRQALAERKIPNFTPSAWEFWHQFLYFHIKRSPAYMDKVTDHYGYREKVLRDAREDGRDPDEAELDRLAKNARVGAQAADPSPEAYEA
jgi:hypothetical protein